MRWGREREGREGRGEEEGMMGEERKKERAGLRRFFSNRGKFPSKLRTNILELQVQCPLGSSFNSQPNMKSV